MACLEQESGGHLHRDHRTWRLHRLAVTDTRVSEIKRMMFLSAPCPERYHLIGVAACILSYSHEELQVLPGSQLRIMCLVPPDETV